MFVFLIYRFQGLKRNLVASLPASHVQRLPAPQHLASSEGMSDRSGTGVNGSDLKDNDLESGTNFEVLGDMDIDLFGEDDDAMLLSPGISAAVVSKDDSIELAKPVVALNSGGYNSSDGEEEVLEGGFL